MGTDGFFAASNSGGGFMNYYNEVFGDADRIFVVKGGPGTGKSRFIRAVAEHAETRGWEAEYYRCSSDPSSFDGVLLKKIGMKSAVIDGTPPHAWEPTLPGVRDTIVNLGDFWDVSELIAHREEIRGINARKGVLWSSAYKWLSGCLDMCGIIASIGAECADYAKINKAAGDMLAGIGKGEGFTLRPALMCSVGMDGAVTSDEYIRRAGTLYWICDRYMTAGLLLRAVLDEARRRELSVLISYDPVDCSRADGIFIENGSFAAVATPEPPKREYIPISMEELIATPDGAKMVQASHAERCRAAMLAGAADALGEIKNLHFRLEQIYSSAMDFDAVNSFTSNFCDKYFP